MVNKERMAKEFMELVRIDSLTFNERKMADKLKALLESYGYSPWEDDAGCKVRGNAGNIICTIKGEKDVPAVLLMAHMDTVSPGTNKNPVMEGDIIKTDGNTVLGADDAAGIECILEAVRVLKEDGIKHGDIQIVFTIAEEGGLNGAKALDYSKIYARYGIVLDEGGPIGRVAVSAPSQNKIDIVVKGKAAHAGVEPEKGISAIQIAAEAISGMKLGRIDPETTANIGVISGGYATNIVCDRVELKAECRSRDKAKLEAQTAHMKECFEQAASKLGGSVEFKSELMYPAFNISAEDEIISILKDAAEEAGVELKLDATGGGSDTNILNGKGIQSVNISVGMEKAHSVEEQIRVDDMVKAVRFLLAIISNIR